MIDAAPPPAPAPAPIIIEAAQDRSPQLLLGLAVFGDEAGLRRLEGRATERGFAAGWPGTDDGSTELLVLFPTGSSRVEALGLYRAALAGEYGTLRVELIIVPVALAADGIDLATEASAVSPDEVVIEQER